VLDVGMSEPLCVCRMGRDGNSGGKAGQIKAGCFWLTLTKPVQRNPGCGTFTKRRRLRSLRCLRLFPFPPHAHWHYDLRLSQAPVAV